MQERSSLYKTMMASSNRDITTASVYIGAVNQIAQKEASAEGTFWEYSDLKSLLDTDSEVEKRYFTWEEKRNRIDGSMYFLPESSNAAVYNNGLATAEICTDSAKPEITFEFATGQLDIRGLTIDFGLSYPLTFTVETNNGSSEYSTTSSEFVTEDVFEGVDYITIIPGDMSNGSTRLRIEKILFGIGIQLTGNKIIDISIKEKTHPISLELPAIDVSLTVDNQDRYFNTSSETSEINFLEKGQAVRVWFSQTLSDGTQEQINGAYALLDNTWKDKGSTAEFSATDRFYQLDGTYYGGIYRAAGTTAYELLVDVLTDAGLAEDEYSIDDYLKEVVIRNPLPKETHANCILLIANACRCMLKQDREGVIVIKPAYETEYFTTSTYFIFERNDMFEEPTIERDNQVKDIIVSRTVYRLSDTLEDIYSDAITISASDSFTVEFNDASIPVSAVLTVEGDDGSSTEVDYGITIVGYSNWCCTLTCTNPPASATDVTLTVKGYAYKTSNPTYTLNVNTTGTTPDPLDNPLIDTVEMAKLYAEWCADYYAARTEYAMSKAIGDPALESYDLSYFENEDGSIDKIRIHTTALKFDGAFNDCSYEGRAVADD